MTVFIGNSQMKLIYHRIYNRVTLEQIGAVTDHIQGKRKIRGNAAASRLLAVLPEDMQRRRRFILGYISQTDKQEQAAHGNKSSQKYDPDPVDKYVPQVFQCDYPNG